MPLHTRPCALCLVGKSPTKINFQEAITNTLKHSLALGTQANHHSAWKHFIAFCNTNQIPQKFHLPADEMVLCTFPAAYARITAGGTSTNHIAALKTYHSLTNMAWKGGPHLAYVGILFHSLPEYPLFSNKV